jgi:hypothetical protein
MATHPIWGVGLLDQTPNFILVLAPSGYVRVSQYQMSNSRVDPVTPVEGTATRPIWSRVTDGTGPFTSLPPYLVSGYAGASTMDVRTNYTVDPTFPPEEPDYLTATNQVRDGWALKVSYPVGAGPVCSSDCFLGVRATADANTQWSGTVHWEEL